MEILQMMAWRMEKALPYGSFHIVILCIGLPIALITAYQLRNVSRHRYQKILFFISFLMLIMEIWKQCFCYFIVNHHSYDWWIFPFQLCSIPMYICLLYPFYEKKWFHGVEVFLMDFNLLGGILALLFPEGLFSEYLALTIHSFIWHFLLVFLGCWIALYQKNYHNKDFLSCIPVFLLCVFLATAFNTIFRNFGTINMFYISCYRITTQPVFHTIAKTAGILFSNILYLCSMCLGAFLIHLGFVFYHKQQHSS